MGHARTLWAARHPNTHVNEFLRLVPVPARPASVACLAAPILDVALVLRVRRHHRRLPAVPARPAACTCSSAARLAALLELTDFLVPLAPAIDVARRGSGCVCMRRCRLEIDERFLRGGRARHGVARLRGSGEQSQNVSCACLLPLNRAGGGGRRAETVAYRVRRRAAKAAVRGADAAATGAGARSSVLVGDLVPPEAAIRPAAQRSGTLEALGARRRMMVKTLSIVVNRERRLPEDAFMGAIGSRQTHRIALARSRRGGVP